MANGSNPTITRIEVSLIFLILTLILSTLFYAIFVSEILMWRSMAVGVSISLLIFLVYPEIRGIKRGDPVIVAVLREIETPTHKESFIDSSITIALEKGRKN